MLLHLHRLLQCLIFGVGIRVLLWQVFELQQAAQIGLIWPWPSKAEAYTELACMMHCLDPAWCAACV